MSPPPAYSPGAKDDTEVFSRRTAPKGGAQDAVREAPQGETSTAGHMGEQPPMETGKEGRIQFGPQSDTIPETQTVPESDRQPPLQEGGTVTCTNTEASNKLMDALQGASILEGHRNLMGTVVEKVQSAKSGLDEAFTCLLTGFEVCDVMSFSRFP